LLERFFSEQDALAEPRRAQLSLPWSATTQLVPADANARVRLVAPRPLDLKTVDGVVEFRCHKKRWRFAADALPVLRHLADAHTRSSSIAELCGAAKERLDEQIVRALVGELLRHGLIAIVAGD
jgi:hypothetical protein